MTQTELFRKVRIETGATLLVETGTYTGSGVAAALAAGFRRVSTWDIGIHPEAAKQFGMDDRVDLRGLSSTDFAFELQARALPVPAVYWLDAHPMAGYRGHGSDEYPLRHELATLAPTRHHLLIDDRRLWARFGVDEAWVLALLSNREVRWATIRERFPDDVLVAI